MLTRDPAGYSILIADDDAGSRETLREIVAPEGFQTVTVSDGAEALDVFQSRPVHLFLCDMHMPKLTGLDVLRFIRQSNNLLPFILVSGDVNEQLMRQALSAKAYSVIAKPVTKSVLIYTVFRALMRAYESTQANDADSVQ